MDELKKALEIAKKSRDSVLADAPSEVSADRGDAETHKSPDLDARDEKNLSYLQTQIIAADYETMKREKLLPANQDTRALSEYKLLRTQVLQKLTTQNWNSIGIVSATSQTGNSATATNLAVALAKEVKHTVLLVDFNWRKPSILDKFGIRTPLGIEDYLFRGVDLSQILINPDMERLVILGANQAIEHSSDIMGSPKVIGLIEELKQRYTDRIIIFDLPPVLETDDAIVFAPYVDTMLMVVAEGMTTPEQLERCAEIFDGKPFIGSVLNRCET